MDFLIWRYVNFYRRLPNFQNKVFWWTQRHCCRALNSQIWLYGTSTLLIFRLTEVIAMVAQLYLLPASFWQK